MLLVHGLNGFKEGWGPRPAALADAGHRVIALDLPGFGESRGAAHHPGGARRRASARSWSGTRRSAWWRTRWAPRSRCSSPPATPPASPRRAAVAVGAGATAPPPAAPGVGRAAAPAGRAAPRPPGDRAHAPRPGAPPEAYLSVLAHPERMADDPGTRALLELASDRLVDADLRAMADWAASGIALDVRPRRPACPSPPWRWRGTGTA